jgi:hypothetical protein
MKHYLKCCSLVALVLTLTIVSARTMQAADDDQFSFKVHNTTDDKITKLLVSEDGEDYGSFDIGKGIKAGETVTLNWDKSTNDKGCKWYIKAVFKDGSETKARRFDFCEEDLELDF